MTFLLNADVGEGMDSEMDLYPYLDLASIACGGHIGDNTTMRRAVKNCLLSHVSIGAHPSYPDRDNFGRVSIKIGKSALKDEMHNQIESLSSICSEFDTKLEFIKPHGALYNDMMADEGVFQTVLEAVNEHSENLPLMIGALPNRIEYQQAASSLNIDLIREAFADRRYLDNGLLQSRTNKNAIFSDSQLILSQLENLLEHGKVITESGSSLAIEAESICIHGDNAASVSAAKAISLLLRV